MLHTCTLFKSLFDTKEGSIPFDMSLLEVIERIKNGDSKEHVEKLRQLTGDEYDQEKKKKEQKKFEKKMENTIMWGIPNGRSYTQVKFKVPLAKIPLIQLQGYINKYKKEFNKGEEFLNTNLEALGVKL